VLVTFEVSMGETSGMLSLCLPYGVIEPVLADFTKRDWFSYRAKKSSPELKSLVERGLKRATVNVAAYLGRTTIRVRELLGLSVGDVIRTNVKVDDQISLVINKHLKYRGKPGKLRGKRAFLVTKATEADEEL